MTKKICCKCKIEKDLSDFYSNHCSKDGKQARCIKCTLEYRHRSKQEAIEAYGKNVSLNMMSNEELREFILQKLAQEKIDKLKRIAFDKNHPTAFTVPIEVFMNSRLFDKSERKIYLAN